MNTFFFFSKKTTRSQKRKEVEQPTSIEQESPLSGNNLNENPVAGTSKSPKVRAEKLKEINFILRKEILSDLTKITAENQKEMLKPIAHVAKKQASLTVLEEFDSEPENAPSTITSTPVRPRITTVNLKTTPVNDRYNLKI